MKKNYNYGTLRINILDEWLDMFYIKFLNRSYILESKIDFYYKLFKDDPSPTAIVYSTISNLLDIRYDNNSFVVSKSHKTLYASTDYHTDCVYLPLKYINKIDDMIHYGYSKKPASSISYVKILFSHLLHNNVDTGTIYNYIIKYFKLDVRLNLKYLEESYVLSSKTIREIKNLNEYKKDVIRGVIK